MADNRQFNVNGPLEGGEQMLLDTLSLAFRQAGFEASGYRVSREKGLILDWTKGAEGHIPFLTKMSAGAVAPMIISWLRSDKAKEVTIDGWDREYHDGDVSCQPGWRVYCEEWGHVQGHQAICAVKPAFMWYGK